MKKLHELYRHSDVILNDAFDRTVVSLHLLSKKNNYKLMVLSGSEPGVGTTTMTINLAISTSVSGWKTLLIDGDMRKNAENKRLSDDVDKGLSDYLTSKDTLDQIVCKTNYENLDYIACGDKVENTVSCLCSNNIDSFISEIYGKYDYIFWDMPALSAAVDTQIIAAKADGVILVSAQNASKSVLLEAKHILEKVDANIIGVIGNKVDKSEYQSYVRDYNYFSSKKFMKNNKNMESFD